ncbi:MAG: AraC family transcriptional regulator [Actinomycetota bacterium]
MDPLTGLLDSPRARGAFVIRMVMQAPWGVRVLDRAPLTIAAVTAGEAWVSPSAGEPRLLRRGEIAVCRGPEPYDLSDRPDTQPEVIVHPGQRCEDRLGRSLEEPFMRGVRTWGNSPDGDLEMIVGTYEHLGESGRRLLDALPPFFVVDRNDVGPGALDLLASELTHDAPGQTLVLDRLLDLVTVSVLRYWFDRHGEDAPGWWRAATDPVVGPALRLLQHNPGHSWTVAEVASEVGVSRALLARRFNELVGQPPMQFLTEWRLSIAADLLLEPDSTVQAVAAQVGYGSGFALSTAFKREHGLTPTEYRAQTLAA